LIDKGCNPEMIELIENYKIKQEVDKNIDPRWETLKNLKNN
jgi:uncharacterized metal-binding protein YceD (DUF177 family)